MFSWRISFLTSLLIMFIFPLSGVASAERTVLVIFSADLPRYQMAHEAFLHSFQPLPQDDLLVVEKVLPDDSSSWHQVVREAAETGTELIITYGAAATVTTLQERPDVPVIFVCLHDPETLGISSSADSSPITGICDAPPLETLIRTMEEIRPLRALGVLFSSADPDSQSQAGKLDKLGRKYGFSLVKMDILDPGDLNPTLESVSSRIDALFLSDDPVFLPSVGAILDFAIGKRLPVISQIPGSGARGALVSLETDPASEGRMAADYARNFFAGIEIVHLPVRISRQVDLVINLNTARQLSLRVPFSALSRATRVIR